MAKKFRITSVQVLILSDEAHKNELCRNLVITKIIKIDSYMMQLGSIDQQKFFLLCQYNWLKRVILSIH